MGRPAKPPAERTKPIALRVREAAYTAACERAGGHDALVERLRKAVEDYAARPARRPSEVTPIPKGAR